MPALSLKNMDVDGLLELRSQVDSQLIALSRDLQKQLARLHGTSAIVQRRTSTIVQRRNGKASVLKGIKVEPKYRDTKTGDTWAGRGMKPVWLTAALKGGKKLEDFLIDKSARKAIPNGRRKRK